MNNARRASKKKKKTENAQRNKTWRGCESKPTLNYMKYEFKAKEVYQYKHKYE